MAGEQMQTFDPSIYGPKPVQEYDTPEQVLPVAPKPVPMASVFKGSPLLAEGAANMAAANREEASALASAGAAMTQWSPVKVFEWLNEPKFDWDPTHDSAAMLKGVPFQMTMEERDFLIKTKSREQFAYRVGNIEKQRTAYEAMGDNPLVAFAAGAADPGYLFIDSMSLGTARVARMVGAGNKLSRAGAGTLATAGALGLGAIEQQVAPVSNVEVVLNALAQGAGTAMAFRGGKLEKVDPRFPEQRLNEVLEEMKVDTKPDLDPDTKVIRDEGIVPPVVEEVPPVKVEVVPPKVDVVPPVDPTDPKLPKELSGAKPRRNSSKIEFDSDVDRALYITAQQTKSKADAKYREWLRGIGFNDAEIDSAGKGVRARIKELDTGDGSAIKVTKVAELPKPRTEVGTAHLNTSASKGGYTAFKPPHAKLSGMELLRNTAAHPDRVTAALATNLSRMLRGTDIEVRLVAREHLYEGSRPFYRSAEHAVYISAGTEPRIQLHEMAHAIMVHRTAYGLTRPDTAIGRTVADLDRVYKKAKRAASGKGLDHETTYYLKNIDEFMAGVYSNHPAFMEFLRGVNVQGRSFVSEIIDVMRRLLGWNSEEMNALTQSLGLMDELAGHRLNATLRHSVTQDGAFSVMHAPPKGASKVEVAKHIVKQLDAKNVAEGISWSLHKTLKNYSEKSKEIADLLVDNPLDMAGNSVVNQQRAIRAELSHLQFKYEDLLSDQLASKGFGVLKRIMHPRKAIQAQREIEEQVGREMLRRNRAAKDGVSIMNDGVPPHVVEMADSLDKLNKRALEEMKRSGVSGAEDVQEMSGYFTRKWDVTKIEDIQKQLMDSGLTDKAARAQLNDMVSIGIQRANGWDADVSNDIARAILDRARRKGYFEDSAFHVHQGMDAVKQIRDVLTGTGISEARMQRVIEVLTGKVDEKGKAPYMKTRVDMHMDESITMPDGTTRSIADMLDFGMAGITERYLDSVSAKSAFARKGMPDSSDISTMRTELAESIASKTEREAALKLFDNTIAYINGLPAGEDMPNFMRKTQAVTQMIGLASSGMWQITEYANAMGRYGMVNTLGSMFKELPGARALFETADKAEATSLRNVLHRNASEDIRIRPYIQRMEDNFEIPASDAVQLSLMQAKQLVPYINAMKYIQNHQARTVANLVVDTFERAAKGDAKAMEALNKYGLESHSMGSIKADILQHGLDTAKWSDATWDAVRAPLTKMMDDAVIRNRTGEIPAFAQFTAVGKFLFTFRSFVLGAHNKILAGTLNRDGFAGLGLLMAYQFPLTAAVTAANNGMQGKPSMDRETLAATALGQMGALGLFSEAWGILSGNKQQFGTPGLIPIDRAYKFAGNASEYLRGKEGASAGDVAAGALSLIPLVSIMPGVKAVGEALKD